MSKRVWSEQQRAIFDWFRWGEPRNLMIIARAGCGKTTTMIEGVNLAPDRRVLVCAFNKKNAVELSERLESPRAESKTLHSVGFSFVRRQWDRIRIDEKGERARSIARAVVGDQAPDEIVRTLARLHTKVREIAPFATAGDVSRLALEHDCVPDGDWFEQGYDLAWLSDATVRAMTMAAATRPASGIDFADMVFLPIRNGWLRRRYDLVVVDECQDMSPAQISLAKGVCAGRLAVVGDDRQAIYAFRGADCDTMERLKGEIDPVVLSLNVTYRCGRSIVQEAAKVVPDFTAAAKNSDGLIARANCEDLPDIVRPGNFVLSRTNAPLVSLALKTLAMGKRATIAGRDIGAGLRRLVETISRRDDVSTIPSLITAVESWRRREVEIAERKDGSETQIDRIHDQADTICALCSGLSSIPELTVRLDNLFSDSPGAAAVRFSSIHRSKGLEAARVFVLADTLNQPPACECGHFAHRASCRRCPCESYQPSEKSKIEGENLRYVAITRAISELVFVDGAEW